VPAVSVLLDRVIEKSASVAVLPALLLPPAADVEPGFESLPAGGEGQRQDAGAQPGEGGDGHGVLQG
jgi:hypothetical protein